MPYIEKVTRPGMVVVFLVRYPAHRLMIDYRGDFKSYDSSDIDHSEMNWWRDRRISRELERRRAGWRRDSHQCSRGRIEGTSAMRGFSRCANTLGKPPAAGQEKLFSVCEPLRKKGREVR